MPSCLDVSGTLLPDEPSRRVRRSLNYRVIMAALRRFSVYGFGVYAGIEGAYQLYRQSCLVCRDPLERTDDEMAESLEEWAGQGLRGRARNIEWLRNKACGFCEWVNGLTRRFEEEQRRDQPCVCVYMGLCFPGRMRQGQCFCEQGTLHEDPW